MMEASVKGVGVEGACAWFGEDGPEGYCGDISFGWEELTPKSVRTRLLCREWLVDLLDRDALELVRRNLSAADPARCEGWPRVVVEGGIALLISPGCALCGDALVGDIGLEFECNPEDWEPRDKRPVDGFGAVEAAGPEARGMGTDRLELCASGAPLAYMNLLEILSCDCVAVGMG